jgi:hypothetical protein
MPPRRRVRFSERDAMCRPPVAQTNIRLAVCFTPFALFYSDPVPNHMLTRRHVLTAAIYHIFSKLCRKNKARVWLFSNARRHVLTDEHWKDMCIEEHCMGKT